VNTVVQTPAPADEARGARAVDVFVRNDAEQLAHLVAMVDRGELRVDDAWAFHEYPIEDVYDFRTLSAGGTRVVGLASATDGDVARSRRCAELFSPVWDYTDELRAPLRVDDATWGGLALFHEGARTFTAAEQEFVASVTGAFARGLRAGIVTGMAALGDAVGPAGPAVLVVGKGGEITQANVGAAARLAELGATSATARSP
jgi:hypothetical protein